MWWRKNLVFTAVGWLTDQGAKFVFSPYGIVMVRRTLVSRLFRVSSELGAYIFQGKLDWLCVSSPRTSCGTLEPLPTGYRGAQGANERV